MHQQQVDLVAGGLQCCRMAPPGRAAILDLPAVLKKRSSIRACYCHPTPLCVSEARPPLASLSRVLVVFKTGLSPLKKAKPHLIIPYSNTITVNTRSEMYSTVQKRLEQRTKCSRSFPCTMVCVGWTKDNLQTGTFVTNMFKLVHARVSFNSQ